MANQLSATGAIQYLQNGVVQESFGVAQRLISITGNGSVGNDGYSVANSDTALPVGGIANLRCLFAINLDPTNNIIIKDAVGGHTLATLLPGDWCFIPLPSTCTAPSTISSAGTPLMFYRVFPI